MRRSIGMICRHTLLVSIALWAGAAFALGEKATSDIRGRDGHEIGKARLLETSAGVLIRFHLKGLPPGVHGVHIHETGKCEGDFESAGAIINPLGNKHGYLNEDGPMAGDLLNLFVPASGEVEIETIGPFLTLSRESDDALLDADGAAIIIHERADDYLTDPHGNAGGRIACGVINWSK